MKKLFIIHSCLLEHCVRDHSDESDEDDGMIDSYGDRVAFDDDSD